MIQDYEIILCHHFSALFLLLLFRLANFFLSLLSLSSLLSTISPSCHCATLLAGLLSSFRFILFLLFSNFLSRPLVSFQKEFRRILNVWITSLGFLLDDANVVAGLKEGTKVLDLHHVVEEVDEILQRDLTVVQLLKQDLLPSLVAPGCLWHLLPARSHWVISRLLLRTSKSLGLLHLTLVPCLGILGSDALPQA